MQSVRFSLQWTLATFVGFLLSLLLIEISEKPDIGVIQGALGGLVVALVQAFVLRERTINSWMWVFSSLAGWVLITSGGIGAVGWIVFTTQVLALRVMYGALLGAIAGFGMGLAHWLAIKQDTPLAWQWILVSSVSWAFGVAIGSAVGLLLHQLTQLFLGEVMGLAVTWLVVSILTGINAHRILK
ncbi:hypothetical protein BZZ01_28825 [Nostocales cyanobacterium HT-58-2]|nr:hypothetical protein BZZ01_28825 [Nostocales cyanobacterium HT-58-2]